MTGLFRWKTAILIGAFRIVSYGNPGSNKRKCIRKVWGSAR
jgi:hypothetical protein